jgi:SAM-dependent methyltransferase
MDPTLLYRKKAEQYARYRWDYAPEAVEAVFSIAGLNRSSVIADIGAGTGILTRHFTGKVKQVYAVEPNLEMRQVLERLIGGSPGCVVAAASAEATGLPAGSLDAILVATAIHWFNPVPTRREFGRILKPGGWLAILHNRGVGETPEEAEAMRALFTAENGVIETSGASPRREPPDFYYGQAGFQRQVFPFAFSENREEFIGAMQSASFVPSEDHPLYPRFEAAARAFFDRFSRDGQRWVCGETELLIGQPALN